MKYNILISIVSWRYLNNVLNIIKKVENSMTKDDYLVLIETGGQRSCDVEQYIAERSNTRIIYSKTNDGFAASHALSVKIMQEKNLNGILLLNPDLEIRDNHIEMLKRNIAESKNNAVLGCPVFNRNGDKLEVEYLGFPVPEGIENDIKASLQLKKPIPSSTYDVKDIHGCFMYIPSVVVKKNGWMDPQYFLYGEENEYLHRIYRNGGRVIVATNMYVIHENGGTFDNEKLKCIREYYRTRNRLYNNYIFAGARSLFKFNFLFVIKYSLARYILNLKSFKKNNITYYNYLGHIHFLMGKRGKTFDPNDYVQ